MKSLFIETPRGIIRVDRDAGIYTARVVGLDADWSSPCCFSLIAHVLGFMEKLGTVDAEW